VTGCYAAVAPQQVESLTGADVVAGLAQKDELVALVSQRLAERGVRVPPRRWQSEQRDQSDSSLIRAVPRTRLNVKVQDGCNDFCTYCIVPFARGRARSVPAEDVIRQIRRAEEEGYQEVVLTGVNMTTYGAESGTSFGALLEGILNATSVKRLRLSSIEPFKFDPAWLDLWSSERLCRHLHLPLQSGCDATLLRMRRRYDSCAYGELIAKIRSRIPDMAVWTDVIAGFPGETEQEFERSLTFIEAMRFAGIHVFRFSPRSGTRAANMPGRVPERIRKERSERLLSLSQQGKRAFAARLVGTTASVLWEDTQGGLTDNYVRVRANGIPNTLGSVLITGLAEDGAEGVATHDCLPLLPN